MSWGAMMGLGQGLQQLGGMISDNYKEKMRHQLEIEREERQDEREKARERWKRSLFSGQYEIDEATGRKYKLDMDHNRIDEGVPLTEREIKEQKQADRLAELTLLGKEQDVEGGGLDLTIKRVTAKNADTMSDLERRLAELKLVTEGERASSLRRSNRGGGRAGAGGEEREPHPLEYANALVKDYKAAFERYGINDGADQQRIAELAVKGAAAEGITPAEYLLRYLANLGE